MSSYEPNSIKHFNISMSKSDSDKRSNIILPSSAVNQNLISICRSHCSKVFLRQEVRQKYLSIMRNDWKHIHSSPLYSRPKMPNYDLSLQCCSDFIQVECTKSGYTVVIMDFPSSETSSMAIHQQIQWHIVIIISLDNSCIVITMD